MPPPGKVSLPPTELTFTILPHCRRRMAGSTSWHIRTSPNTLVSNWAAIAGAYEGPLAKLGGGPDDVARKIAKAISQRRPRARYPVTPSARMILGLHTLLPDRGWDAFTATSFPRPKP
jgi:hypothetical protein